MPVREVRHQDGKAVAAQVEGTEFVRRGVDAAILAHGAAVLPETVPVNKEIPVFRRISALEHVLELWGKYGQVIQDDIEGQVQAEILERFQILLRCQLVAQVVADD